MKQTLYLIRHGHTAGTEATLMYGATELPLTKDGLDEIAVYSDAGIYPDPNGAAVYTSGMIRALQTLAVMYGADPGDVHVRLEDIYPEKDGNIERIANNIAELCSVPHDTEPMLREVDLGAYEMTTVDEILEYEFGRKWIGGEIDEPDFPGGDTDRGFQDRINRGRQQLGNAIINSDKCDWLMECFESWEYRELTSVDDWAAKPKHDRYSHLMDAYGYACDFLAQVSYLQEASGKPPKMPSHYSEWDLDDEEEREWEDLPPGMRPSKFSKLRKKRPDELYDF